MDGETRTIGPSELLAQIFALIRNPSRALFDISEGADKFTCIETPDFRFIQINDAELARRLLTQHSHALAKGPFFARSRDLLGDGILTSDEPAHGRRRHRMIQYFSGSRMDGYGDALRAIVGESLSSWIRAGTIDASQQVRELTLAAVLNCFFGTPESVESQSFLNVFAGELESYTASRLLTDAALASPAPIDTRDWGVLDRAAGSALKVILGAYSLQLTSRADTRDRMREFPDTLISDCLASLEHDTRSAQAASPDNLLTGLCELIAGTPQEDWSRSAVCDELLTVLLAGHETTANSLVWSLALVGASGKYDTQNPLLVDQVILETLRLYPPAWVIPRIVTEEFQADGFDFGVGTQLLISPYLYHRRSEFSEPDEFRPERWTSEMVERPPLAFMPFGVGDRACIGQRFAWLEMRTLLTSVFQRVHVSLLGPIPEPEFLLTLRPSGRVKLRVSEV